MKVSRSLVDCSVHSETHSHQRVGRELVGRKHALQERANRCVKMNDYSYIQTEGWNSDIDLTMVVRN